MDRRMASADAGFESAEILEAQVEERIYCLIRILNEITESK